MKKFRCQVYDYGELNVRASSSQHAAEVASAEAQLDIGMPIDDGAKTSVLVIDVETKEAKEWEVTATYTIMHTARSTEK